jgi:hypothetical protein
MMGSWVRSVTSRGLPALVILSRPGHCGYATPAIALAGPGQFRGQAATGEHSAGWDLAITGEQPPLRPLRPPVLYRAPLPRTKLEAVVPDGQVTGMLQVDGHAVSVSGWRGTAGHNWDRSMPIRGSGELIMQRPGNRELTLSSSHAAYEYGARQPIPGIVPRSLPEG